MSSTFKTWFVPAALAVGLSGCIFVEDDGDDIGTLEVGWTVIDDDTPSICRATGSDRLELAVFDFFDDHVTTLYPRCDDFVVALSLDEGYYTAEATLVDRFNDSVTQTLVLDDLDVVEGLALEVSIDFPPDSFF